MNKMVEKFPLSVMTKTVKQMMGETLGKNVGEKTATALIPQKSMLVNYPNPFNPSTVIKYAVGTGSKQMVILKVFDILGNEIATLVNEEKEPGIYNYQFSILNYQLPSGVYFYQLRAGDFAETKKMILQK